MDLLKFKFFFKSDRNEKVFIVTLFPIAMFKGIYLFTDNMQIVKIWKRLDAE